MSDRDIAEFVLYCLGRNEHLARLAAVTDVRTMARYLLAVHDETGAQFRLLAAALDSESVAPLPN